MTEWRCKKCWKVASGKHAHCPFCGGRWDKVQEPSFVPQDQRGKSPRAPSRGRTPHRSWDGSWEWNQGRKASQSSRDRSPSAHQKPQQRRRGKKKKGKDSDIPVYAAPEMPSPWKPNQDMAKGTASTSSSTTVDAEMAKDLRAAYPNPALMPEEVKRIVERYDAQMVKWANNAMASTVDAMGKSRESLKKLHNARTKHRSSWLTHMKSLMGTLEKQVAAYESQQMEYDKRIVATKKDIQKQRRELQRLNAQVATEQKRTLPQSVTEEEDGQEDCVDVEEADLRSSVQELLARCLKRTDATIEIVSEDEEAMDTSTERTAKRQRSLEPAPSSK